MGNKILRAIFKDQIFKTQNDVCTLSLVNVSGFGLILAVDVGLTLY